MQGPPPKKSQGLKYALIGCGCLVLIGAGGVIAALAMGGFSKYMARAATKPGGADCAAAAACCNKILTKSGVADHSSCDQFKHAPAMACMTALHTYKRSAASMGISCP